MNIESIIHGLLIGWWWTNFTPWQNLLTKYVKPYIKWQYINQALSCFKCQSFWWTLGLTQNIYDAIIAAVFAFTYDKVINSFKTYM